MNICKGETVTDLFSASSTMKSISVQSEARASTTLDTGWFSQLTTSDKC